MIRPCLLALTFLLLGWAAAGADVFVAVDRENITVCPAFDEDTVPPPLNRDGCNGMSIWDVDPQGRHIWVFFDLTVPQDVDNGPMGIGVYAKASSQIFLNGALVGKNGQPGDSRATEITGLMDQIFLLSPGTLKTGQNRVAIRMSSHAGVLKLSSPIHGVFVTSMTSPQAEALKRYWPSLLPFGAFVLGSFYFLVSAVRRRDDAGAGLLAIMSGAAAVQVMVEVSRGLWAYPYWFHDLRLLSILACATLFAMSLAAYVILRFRPQYKVALFIMATVLIAGAIILPQGFDTKASYALLASTLFSAAVALSAASTMKGNSVMFAACLFGFAAINFVGAGQFLDSYFYYAVAALLLFLFAQQAAAFAKEASLRRSEEARADRLQYVLDRLETSTEQVHISVTSTGRTHRIVCDDIAYIQGAGDYVELVMHNSDIHLHSATLTDLEDQLPTSFLRVHRSYLVNSTKIMRLERHSSGTGELVLSTGQTIPVSRRIMPKVKAALA